MAWPLLIGSRRGLVWWVLPIISSLIGSRWLPQPVPFLLGTWRVGIHSTHAPECAFFYTFQRSCIRSFPRIVFPSALCHDTGQQQFLKCMHANYRVQFRLTLLDAKRYPKVLARKCQHSLQCKVLKHLSLNQLRRYGAPFPQKFPRTC